MFHLFMSLAKREESADIEQASSAQTLEILDKLIEEASALRASLAISPSETVSVADFERIEKIREALKTIEAGLRASEA